MYSIRYYKKRNQMNKPLLLSLATASILSTSLNAESMYERFETMEKQMQEMQEEITTLRSQQAESPKKEVEVITENKTAATSSAVEDSDENDNEEDESDDEEMNVEEEILDIQESITDLNKATNSNHLKFNVDYRFSLDNLQYKMANGETVENNAFMTNRLWINMNWKATDNLSFRGQLAYNKAFGGRSGIETQQSLYETFDWITNENAYDGVVRVRSVYFLYKNDTFMSTDIPWTFSIGRRPSTNGHLVNLRDDDEASSPMGHSINVEFDGLSSKFSFEDLTGVDGMYIKLCAGRGLTNASPRFSPDPYETTEDDVNNIDLAGIIIVPYNDGQYGIATQYYYAHNLIDARDPQNQAAGFDTVGNIHSFTANFTMNGIGDEWSDYLDDTFFFLSGALSVTDPTDRSAQSSLLGYDPTGMLGSTESEKGYSVWAGIQMPSLITEDGKWGLEYNWGSQYWRSITYAEDTNIGSKLAARGNAYEIYFTEPLVEEILSLQIRYTYIDYDYSGSNGFFGNTTGTAMSIEEANAAGYGGSVVDKAQDIRFYLRYRY
jgi:hypothetical protein